MSPEIYSSSVVKLTVVSYNTYQEKNGRDLALDMLLSERDVLACLQEISPARALNLYRTLGKRAFISLARHGLQYLALVLPHGARFVEHRTVQLNGHYGIIPRGWSLRRGWALYKAGLPTWPDALEPRVAQVARILWEGRTFEVINTHLPLDAGLRNRCLSVLQGLLCEDNALLVGDLNATLEDLFLNDLILAEGLQPAGTDRATHNSGRRIDYVLFRGGFREVDYELKKTLSDHRLVRVKLEI